MELQLVQLFCHIFLVTFATSFTNIILPSGVVCTNSPSCYQGLKSRTKKRKYEKISERKIATLIQVNFCSL
jgi:hypothetical protein